mmetsp:Transcript_21069/g.45958  ORF Transcript_21069/g.45958 Transcript_21069/m.45958 type:complete len:283 (-) Transcript_21069:1147-1995(-)
MQLVVTVVVAVLVLVLAVFVPGFLGLGFGMRIVYYESLRKDPEFVARPAQVAHQFDLVLSVAVKAFVVIRGNGQQRHIVIVVVVVVVVTVIVINVINTNVIAIVVVIIADGSRRRTPFQYNVWLVPRCVETRNASKGSIVVFVVAIIFVSVLVFVVPVLVDPRLRPGARMTLPVELALKDDAIPGSLPVTVPQVGKGFGQKVAVPAQKRRQTGRPIVHIVALSGSLSLKCRNDHGGAVLLLSLLPRVCVCVCFPQGAFPDQQVQVLGRHEIDIDRQDVAGGD